MDAESIAVLVVPEAGVEPGASVAALGLPWPT